MIITIFFLMKKISATDLCFCIIASGEPNLRLVEVDVDTHAYASGHIPGALAWDWRHDTQQPLRRDIPDRAGLEALLSRSGITPASTVVV